MPHIASTLAADMEYTQYRSEGNLNVPIGKVFVAGKANIRNKHLVAPQGVLTQVTDDELAALEQDEVFQLHKKNGHIKILRSKSDPDKVSKDMVKDNSAPYTPKDYEKGGRALKDTGLKDVDGLKGLKAPAAKSGA